MRRYITAMTAISFVIVGCSDYKDELLLQHKTAIRSGKLCIAMLTDSNCKTFVADLGTLNTTFNKHGAEAFQEAARGDKKSQEIVLAAAEAKKIVDELEKIHPNK